MKLAVTDEGFCGQHMKLIGLAFQFWRNLVCDFCACLTIRLFSEKVDNGILLHLMNS